MPGQQAQTIILNDGIVAIDAEYVHAQHVASHLIVENGRAAYVDTGINDSVPLLIDALTQQDLDVGDVDYVFLTHVHLDHAGGAASLMQRLPNALCVVHRYGARHMIDPARLIAGVEAVYGKQRTRELYGEILPIDERRIIIADDDKWLELSGRALQTIYTEGHARHHYVLNDPRSKGVFTGDSFGVSYRALDTAKGATVFPTTTPVQFDPHEAHKAVDRIMDCGPEQLYLTHYSCVRDVDRLATEMHEGLDAYVTMAREHEHDEDRNRSLQASMFAYFVQRLTEHGFTGDQEIVHAVLDIDVDLNTKGLEVWLDKQT
jgi:glyoxylase-like metal-dependent hydrolase (beta-lactamase superfamily II)